MARVIAEAAVRLTTDGTAAAEAASRAAGERAGRAYADGFSRDANGRLRDTFGRVVADGDQAAERVGRSFGLTFPRIAQQIGLLNLGPLIGQAGRLVTILGAASLASLGGQAALAGIVQLTAALSQLGGVVALIPALYATAGIAVGALRVGFMGFGEALSNLGDPAKFAEAIEGLAPAAQQAATAIRDLKTSAFDPLQLEVQQVLFQGLGERIAELGQRYLPVTRSAFNAIAAAANQAALSVARVLLDPARVADLSGVAVNTALSFRRIAAAAAPLSAALIDLIAVGSDFLPGLSGGIAEAAEMFALFIANARETGQLHAFISNALDAFGQLATILGNLGATVGAVFSAANAAGSGLLGTLASLTGQLREVAQSAAGQEALAGFFAGAAQAVSALLPAVGGLVQVFGALGPVLGEIGTVVGPVLGEVLNTLAASITQLGPTFVTIFRTIGQAVITLLPVVQPVLAAIATAIGALLPAVQPLAEAFAAVVLAVAPLLPVLARLVAVVLVALAPALTTIAEALAPVIAAFADELGPIITDLTPVIRDLAMIIAQILAGSLSAVLPLIVQLAPLFGQLAVTIGQALLTALEALAPHLPALIGAFVQLVIAVTPLLPPLAQLIVLAAQIVAAIAPLIGILAGLVAAFARVAGMITGPLAGALSFVIGAQQAVVGAFREGFGSIPGAVSGAVGTLIGIVRGIPGQILGALGNLGGLLTGAGRAVVQGLIDGIRGMLGSLASVASSVASTIRDRLPFSPAKVGPLRDNPPDEAGRTIVEMLAGALLQARPQLAAAVETLLAGSGLGAGLGTLAPVVPGGAATVVVSGPTTPEPRDDDPDDGTAGGDSGMVLNLFDVDGVLLGTMRAVVADDRRNLKRRAGARAG